MTTAEIPAPPARRARRSRSERWPEIIGAATDVFAEKGYNVASLHDIANRLGMLKGSLYHYIDSKEDLLFHIIRAAHDELYETVAGLAHGPGNAFQRLEMVIFGHLDFVCGNLQRTRVFLHELRSVPLARRRELLGSRHPYQTLLRDLIAEAKAEGLARPEINPHIAALTLLGSLNWAYRWYSTSGEASPAQISRNVADLTLHSLALPGATLTPFPESPEIPESPRSTI